MRKVILITGAAGFVGRRLAVSLRSKGENVHMWTRGNGDLRNGEAVKSALHDMRPTCIYHLASSPISPADNQWKRIADEQQMLANLAYSMPTYCTLIYTGSMAEYGKSGVLGEADQCTPDTSYGCAKFSGTNLSVALRTVCGLDIRVARLFGVYGPGEAQSRLLPMLITKLLRGETVPLSDGAQLRDFIHVDDVCAALTAFANAPPNHAPVISNIGTGLGVTVRMVCERVAEILRADTALLNFGAIPRRSVDQDCLVANTNVMKGFANPPPQHWLDKKLSEQVVHAMSANIGN